MRAKKEVQAEIRELKREMKENGIKLSSFMNRHPSVYSAQCNARLFRLKLEIEDIEKASSK